MTLTVSNKVDCQIVICYQVKFIIRRVGPIYFVYFSTTDDDDDGDDDEDDDDDDDDSSSSRLCLGHFWPIIQYNTIKHMQHTIRRYTV